MDNSVRSFRFNSIIVIESLPANDTQTGTILYNDLLRWKAQQLDFLSARHFAIANRRELLDLLNAIHERSIEAGLHPILHFEIHGNPNGLVLAAGETIPWKEIATLLRQINIVVKNELFVSLVTCYGAYLFGEAHPGQPAPFFGFIGSWEEITEAFFPEDFYRFYDYLLSYPDLDRIDFAQAIQILNGGREPITYGVYFGEQIFERVMKEHRQTLKDKAALKQRAMRIASDAGQATGQTSRRERRKNARFVETRLLDGKIEAEYKKKFLMLS